MFILFNSIILHLEMCPKDITRNVLKDLHTGIVTVA